MMKGTDASPHHKPYAGSHHHLPNTLLKLTIATALCLPIAACSNQQIYEAIQQANQQECQKNQKTARERCMEQVSEPYERYESDRQELLGEAS